MLLIVVIKQTVAVELLLNARLCFKHCTYKESSKRSWKNVPYEKIIYGFLPKINLIHEIRRVVSFPFYRLYCFIGEITQFAKFTQLVNGEGQWRMQLGGSKVHGCYCEFSVVKLISNSQLSHTSTGQLDSCYSDKCPNHLQKEVPCQPHHKYRPEVRILFILPIGNLRKVR